MVVQVQQAVQVPVALQVQLALLELRVGLVSLDLRVLREPQARRVCLVLMVYRGQLVAPVLLETLEEVGLLVLTAQLEPQVQRDFQALLETLVHQVLAE